MEVAIGGNGSSPFQREVREWQRVDPNTGALLTGRLEADRWINGPLNAYGKVVDSQNVSQPNGTQHSQRKQFEVLQARTSSGSLQVVRAQTVQTSSSRWSSSGTKAGQSSDAPRFSIPLQITNGHHGMTNGHEDHFNHQSHQFVTEPSLKLSTLMKSSTASSSGTRSSPLSSPMGSMSQRHHHDATPSISTDVRYRPTIEDRVGGSGGSLETHNKQLFEGARIERETSDSELLQHLHRGRSISTDDLASTDWDQNDNDGSESSEWRRVSKIRRSFQFPKSTSPKLNQTRPVDLPENSVSVSRIRQELENGRRLSTAMRNNHVDLAALDNILNGSPETESKSSKKSTFLTAESLKEIRGKLKKLSDESLYKEDFITQNDIEKTKSYDDCPQEGFIVQKPVILQDSQTIQQPSFQFRPTPEAVHTTNSLENRARHRDTTSAEWHLRRKSYGFEKMAPSSNSMFREDSSTDSGIGRSSELTNWSSTENATRGTVVTFGDSTSSPKSRVALMNSQLTRRFKDPYDSANDMVEVKRHSIAVDESKYVRDNLRKVFDAKTSIHLNGFYSKEIDSSHASVFDDNGKRHRRVEFCKTEVHFAAESGRVNIVETDGKPPPTNNFRRRRRSSGAITSAYMDAINSGRPVTHFGDDRKSQLELEASAEETRLNSNIVTVITNGGPDVILPCTVEEEEEDQLLAEEISIRGILKNKPVKPKPYHLGDNIESSESLWGVRLRPVSGEFSLSKPDESTVSETRDTTIANNSVAERVRIVEERKDGAGYSTKINLNLSNSPYSWEAPELPKSNVLSIELHSPTATLQRTSKEAIVSSKQDVPVAKPRNINSVKTNQSTKNDIKEDHQTDSTRKNQTQIEVSDQKAPLKIENGGTRKLKDHELLYFGVKLSNDAQQTSKTHHSIVETNRKNSTNSDNNTQKWKLSSDKPDLLRHSPTVTKVSHSKESSTTTKTIKDQHDNQTIKKGPIYENLKKPTSYNRNKDDQRNQMILNEMNKEADQALKAISSDKLKKDHNCRSSQRSSKPLDTIDEKRSSKLRQQSAKIVAVRQLGEAYHRQCCSNRSSSVSSTESLSRLSGSNRSKESTDYVNMRSSKKRTPLVKEKTHRSSSRDTQRTNASSSEDLHLNNNSQNTEAVRRSRKSRPKEKEKIVVKVDEQQRITRSDDRTKVANKSASDSTKASLRSSKGDKYEKTGTTRSKVSSIRSSSDSRKMSRSKPSTGIVSSTSSSSKRSSRDHTRK